MSDRYPGGLIRKTPPTITPPVDGEGGSAPGIWTLEEVAYYEKAGGWPKPVLPRELYTWGTGTNGRTGHNDTVNRSSPVQVGALTTWRQVSVGNFHTVAVKTDGTLWTWGASAFGRLGNNNDFTDRSSPTQVGALTNWSQVSAGDRHNGAIKTDGTLWTWGRNNSGQLGQNNTVYASSPVQVGALTTWSQVSGGTEFIAAIKTDGTLWAWGLGDEGRTGLNESQLINRSSPVQVGALSNWLQVYGGYKHCAAVKTDGTLWTWGQGNTGKLGQNNQTSLSSPVQVGALTAWSQVSAGAQNTAAVKTDGTLWTWGSGTVGQLGQNNTIYRSSPVQVGSLTTWSESSAGEAFMAAVKTDGTLWAWGDNAAGRLGTNTNQTVDVSSPVQIGASTNWNQVSTKTQHVAAITKG